MAFNPPDLGFPGYFPPNPNFPPFPPNPYFPTPPQQPQAPPRFPPPYRAPPPPRRAPPPPPPPRRAPPPPPPPPPRRAPPPRVRPPPLPPTPRPRPPPSPVGPLPPPKPVPPPPPPSPPPPPHVVIVVVFVSLGGLLLLGCLAALFCWHKKRKAGAPETERKAEVLNFSDRVHVHKDTMSGGPEGGAKAVRLTVDEDVKFQEAVRKQDAVGEASDTGHHHSSWHRHKKHHGREEKETELINVTGHKHVEEKIMPGPHGDRIEVLSEDEDISFEAAEGKKEVSENSKAHIFKS